MNLIERLQLNSNWQPKNLRQLLYIPKIERCLENKTYRELCIYLCRRLGKTHLLAAIASCCELKTILFCSFSANYCNFRDELKSILPKYMFKRIDNFKIELINGTTIYLCNKKEDLISLNPDLILIDNEDLLRDDYVDYIFSIYPDKKIISTSSRYA